MLRVLDLLLIADGERLSYRTLDVEQIGSVYETVMGFTVETLAGPALAIQGGKNDRTPVFVDLAALRLPRDRAAEVAERGGRPTAACPIRSARRSRRRRAQRNAGRGAAADRGRARLAGAHALRRPARRCCSRPTNAAAPAATTRRAR